MLEYHVDTNYVLIFKDLVIDIYEDGTHVSSVVSPYSGSEVRQLKWTQADSILVLVHPDYAPYLLVRGATSALWTLDVALFKFYPVEDFDGGYDAITFTPSATSGTVTITASANIFTAAHVGGVFEGNAGM